MQCEVLRWDEFDRFHEEFYLQNRPAVIRGLRETRATQVFDWSVEHLTELMGSHRVPILETATGFLSYERDTVEMPFDDFAGRLNNPGGPSFYFKNPVQMVPGGEQDADRVPELRPYLGRAVLQNLWVSGSGLTVGLHFDAAENLNFQLRGRKSFTLHRPGVRGYYPMPMFSQTAHISRIFRNGPDPDLAQFPRFDPSASTHLELTEGDILYIPAYWWHQVSSLADENVNLNFWWLPSLKKQLTHPNQALRGHLQLALRYLKFGNLQKAPPQTEAST